MIFKVNFKEEDFSKNKDVVSLKPRCQSCSLMLMSDYEFFRDVGESSIQKGGKNNVKYLLLYHAIN